MSLATKWWHAFIRSLTCLVCKRFTHTGGRVALHHVAEGSSKRSEYAVVPLCDEHHQGSTGLHGVGTKQFCVMWRVPWEKEEGLLVWLLEDIAERMRKLFRAQQHER